MIIIDWDTLKQLESAARYDGYGHENTAAKWVLTNRNFMVPYNNYNTITYNNCYY